MLQFVIFYTFYKRRYKTLVVFTNKKPESVGNLFIVFTTVGEITQKFIFKSFDF